MLLDHHEACRIKLDRVQPKRPNSCRLSVAANAINFFAGTNVMSPERVLSRIDQYRQTKGLPPVDLNTEAVLDEEVHAFFKDYSPDIEMTDVYGERFLDVDFLEELLDAGCIIAADHLLLYCDPSWRSPNSLGYIPEDLLQRMLNEEFTYQTFIEFQLFIAKLSGDISHGHVDIILDIKQVAGQKCLILANLASYGNEYPIAVPWDFYRHYLAFDWGGGLPMANPNILPDPDELSRLKEEGYLERDGLEFFHGGFEIYFPVAKKQELEAIIAKYSQKQAVPVA